MPSHSERKSLEPVGQQEGVEGVCACSERVLHLHHDLHPVQVLAEQHTANRGPVAVLVLGGGMHYEVDVIFEWLLEIGRRKRVVRHHGQVVLFAQFR